MRGCDASRSLRRARDQREKAIRDALKTGISVGEIVRELQVSERAVRTVLVQLVAEAAIERSRRRVTGAGDAASSDGAPDPLAFLHSGARRSRRLAASRRRLPNGSVSA